VGSRTIRDGVAVQPRIIGQNVHLWPAIGRAARRGDVHMASRSWFFATDGQQHGPYPEDQFRDLIRRGAIRQDTYVWSEGMPAWQFAGDIPGLLSGGPPPVSQTRVQPVVTGGQGAAAFSLDAGVWELFGRGVVLAISFLLIVPVPWALVWYYRWFVSRLHIPQWPNLGFTGQPMDLWWYLPLFALQLFSMLVTDISALVAAAQLVLYWLVVRWFVANLTSNGQSLSLKFEGSFWGYLGWNILFVLAAFTIIGWAWVATAWTRWICRNISGSSHEVFFIATGWEMLWRTLACGVACLFIIPIPWAVRWYLGWYVSQFGLATRNAVTGR
jgi:GYF domain 2